MLSSWYHKLIKLLQYVYCIVYGFYCIDTYDKGAIFLVPTELLGLPNEQASSSTGWIMEIGRV